MTSPQDAEKLKIDLITNPARPALTTMVKSVRISTKLTIAYTAIVVVVAAVLAFTLYIQLRQAQLTAIRAHLRDVVGFAVTRIDADFHTLIVSSNDAENSYYRIIKENLQQIQATSSVIKHIYTLRQRDDGTIVFVVDNGSPVRQPAMIGQRADKLTPLLSAGTQAIKQTVVEEQLATDLAGQLRLYGYGSITDQFGRQDGVLAIELDASLVTESEAHARNVALLVFFITLPLVLLTGGWLARRVTAPVQELLQGTRQIAQGQFDQRVPVHSGDELGALATTFNMMADSLQARIVAQQHVQEQLQLSHRQLQEYNHTLEQAVREQQRLSETVRKMSLPVIPVAEKIIVVPLVGTVDSERASEFSETLLHGIEQHQARVALIDLTGAPVVDDLVARALLQAITAARLLGTKVLLVGIRPELAETFVHIYADLSGIESSATLQSGLLQALRLIGRRVVNIA